MKAFIQMRTICLGLFPIVSLVSCGSRELPLIGKRDLSIVDQISLGETEMTFEHKGAQISECSLIGQFERGRSSSTNGAGTGCSACSP